MEVMVTTGAISRAKFQSNHHHQHPVFTDRMPFLRPTTNVKAMKVLVTLKPYQLLL